MVSITGNPVFDTGMLTGAIVGVINLLWKTFPKVPNEFKVVAVVAAGALIPFIPFDNAVVQGVLIALNSSGLYKGLQVIRGQA